MNMDTLEIEYYGKRHKYVEDGFEVLKDEDIEILVLFEMWKDGAGPDIVQELKDEGTYKNREAAIRELVDHFGYLE